MRFEVPGTVLPYSDEATVEAACDDRSPVETLTAARSTIWHVEGLGDVPFVSYALVGCPEVAKSNIIFAARDESGNRSVLGIGRVEHHARSLNLADIRQMGATLGANEIHIHTPAGGLRARTRMGHHLHAAAEDNRLTCRET